MSKRPHEAPSADPPSPSKKAKRYICLPDWARGSGIDDVTVEKFLAFMRSQGVSPVVNTFDCECERAWDPLDLIGVAIEEASLVQPSETRVVCKRCAHRCSICDEPGLVFYWRATGDDSESDEGPSICYKCSISNKVDRTGKALDPQSLTEIVPADASLIECSGMHIRYKQGVHYCYRCNQPCTEFYFDKTDGNTEPGVCYACSTKPARAAKSPRV